MHPRVSFALPLILLAGLVFWMLGEGRQGGGDQQASGRGDAAAPGRGMGSSDEPLAEKEGAPGSALALGSAVSRSASHVPLGHDALIAFDEWLEAWLQAPLEERAELLERGIALAEARRSAFRNLISSDPEQALARAVPMVARQALPSEITSLLERRVNHVGTLRTYIGCPDPEAEAPTAPMLKRVAELKDDLTYAARVFGAHAATTDWETGRSLNGVALDSEFAVSNLRARPLEPGELPNPQKPLVQYCPEAGASMLTELSPEAIAVESAIEVVQMCDCHAQAADVYDESIRMAEGATGGPLDFTGILPAAPTPSIGVVKVLYMPVTYADQNAIPVTEARAYETMRDVSDYYAKGSYGKLTLLCTVTPPVKLPHNEAWYNQQDTANGGNIDGEGMSHRHARDEVRKLGFDTNDFDTHIMRHTGGPGSYGGLAGGSTVWIRSDGGGLSGHEIGHTFGLPHANFWDTGGTSSIGAGINEEYGHSYDIMGSSGAFPAGHYNAQGKKAIRWLPDSFVRQVSQSGEYRIHAFDQPSLNPRRSYALNITKDAQRVYWLESRSLYPSVPWIHQGAMIGWRFPSGGANNIQMIDTTPGSPFGKEDAPVALGQTFSDHEAGIHITTVAANTEPHYVDVRVNFGRFEGNQRPTLALDASSEVVPVNGTVTFTATASDPDGDPLAYSWQHFGLTSFKVVEASSPVITRTFPTAGTYVVACTVSDMKGGISTRWKLITVGSGNSRFTISGRITLGADGVPNVGVTANGTNGVVTDDDGYFTIPNLSANTYTLTPLRYGFTFSEQFNNSITVGPNFDGANFSAAPAPAVTLTASTPDAAENPQSAGVFTLTRTGDTAQALVVNVNTVQGTATLTSDFTFSPAYVAGSQGYHTFTIPPGSASLDIQVTPVNDSSAEGPETVILQIAPATAYVVAGAAEAQVVIADDDTSLPRVSVTRLTQDLLETDTATPIARFTRTGPTGAALNASYTVTGTATAGSDYAVLSGTIQIPAGEASADLELSPIDNTLSESLETVLITLAVGGAYVNDPTSLSALVNIIDDDVQLVTVEASDPAAAEVDLTVPGAKADTGTFLVTRVGDLSQPLTVYYSLSGTVSSGAPALHGVDYEALPGVLVIPAGESQASVTLVPRHDGIGEGPENVVFQLGAGPTNYLLGEVSSAEVIIADHPDDLPVVEVIATARVIENTTNGNFRFSVRGAGTGTLVIRYTISGTATAGSDYNISGLNTSTLKGSVTVNLANGVAVVSNLTITRINDSLPEDLESITLTIDPDPAYQTFAPTASASTWIQDDDQNTVFVDAQVGTATGAADTFKEGDPTSPVRFYLSRTGSTAAALTVNYTLSGTATAGSDYTALPGSITIPAGSLSTSLNLTILNDTVFEGTESIVFNLSPGSYGVGVGVGTIYIADNETSSQLVRFSSDASSGLESVTAVSVPVTLASPATTPVTVEYLPESGVRTNNSAQVSSITLPYWVRLVRNGSTIQGFRSSNGTAWTQISSNQTINLPPEMLVGLAVSSRSDGILSTAVFDSVTVSPAPSEPLRGRSVGYLQAQGSDAESGGTYTIEGSGAGIGVSNQDECHFLSAPLTGDFTLTARVVSLNGGGSSAEAGVMARENVGWRHRSVSVVFQAPNTIQFRRRTTSSMTTLGAGIDHDLAPGVLNFGIGEQTKNITFNVANDTVNEPTENLVIKLLNPSGAQMGTPDTFIYSILDDDDGIPVPHVGFASAARSAVESAGTVSIPVSLSATAETSVSVDYAVTGGTASFGGDHTLAAGTLNFPIGSSVNAISVPLVDDAVIEPAETLVLTLSSPSGAVLSSQTSHTLTILDDDLPVVTVVSNDPVASEEGLDPGSVTFTRTGDVSAPLNVTFSLGGTATGGSDYTHPGSTILISAGESDATLLLTPIDDTANEGTEAIVVSIAPDAAYTVGTPSTATVTILDNDRSTVTIVATDPEASETLGNTGQFTLTRTAPTTASLTVTLTRSGTATSGTDYSGVSTSYVFNPGQTERIITVTPIDDSITEGPEQVTLSINAGSYDIGGTGFASVTILDNDSPPVIYIASPSAQGPLIGGGNGVIVSAIVTDDGAPQPVSVEWSQASGPGIASFETPTQSGCAVSFDTPGQYVLQITATDGQFTVRDQVSVAVGAALTPSPWISQDTSPISSRRGQGFVKDGVFTISATGVGVTGSTSDQLHLVARQTQGDASLTVRLTSVDQGSNPFAGILVRKTLSRQEIRCALGYRAGNLELRTRPEANAADIVDATIPGVSLPVWLRLVRDATAQTVTASYAPDNAGAPGAWTPVGAPVALTLNDLSIAALGAASGSTGNSTTAVFDNVTLTPTPAGAALLKEHLGISSPETGTYAENGGSYTISGSGGIDGGGSFYGWQFTGDLVITAKQVDATSSAGSAKSGIMIRESMDNGGYVHFGRMPTSAFNGYIWRSVAGGSSDGLPTFTGKTRWLRMIRQGNAITAFHAPDAAGSPGTWIQVGQPQTIVMTSSVLVGFAVDNASGVGLNTVTFSDLSIEPLNRAPVITHGAVAMPAISPVALGSSITDDNFPAPPAIAAQWSRVSGPGSLSFSAPTAAITSALLDADGAQVLRLRANDGSAESFANLAFTGFTSPTSYWQVSNFPGGAGDADAALLLDPDFDGLANLMEYALGTNPNEHEPSHINLDQVETGGQRYLRLQITKNPLATDTTVTVQATGDLTHPASWSSAGLIIEEDSATTLRVRDSQPMSAGLPRFMRGYVQQN